MANQGPFAERVTCEHRLDELEAELLNLDLQTAGQKIWFTHKICRSSPVTKSKES